MRFCGQGFLIVFYYISDIPKADTSYSTIQKENPSVPLTKVTWKEPMSTSYEQISTSKMSETKSNIISTTSGSPTEDKSYRTTHMDYTSVTETD